MLHHEVSAGHLVSFVLYAQELGGALEVCIHALQYKYLHLLKNKIIFIIF